MPTAHLTITDIAEIYDGLGDTYRAELYRSLDQPDPDAVTVSELVDSIGDLIDDVPDPATNTKHDDTCWKKHAACLADKIEELLPS